MGGSDIQQPLSDRQSPNIVLIFADDMGFSDIGCFGGEIETPNLDRLAQNGMRFSHFYSTARCCPSRASLLSGLHPHQVGVGLMVEDLGLPGYRGELSNACVTIPEVLRDAGYRTYMAGKWHVSRHPEAPRDQWPTRRGFDRFWGTIIGAGSYYQPATLTDGEERVPIPEGEFFYTDAIAEHAAGFIREHCRDFDQGNQGRDSGRAAPFFEYVAFTAPHWPLHAPPEEVKRYDGRFDAGWDVLREERLQRLHEMGILPAEWRLSDRDSSQPAWAAADHKGWRARRMEVYAAQVTTLDRGIGRIVSELEQQGELDNTLILFLSDNGGCAEELDLSWKEPIIRSGMAPLRTRDGEPTQYGNDPACMPGGDDTYQSYGVAWANLSNTPFRLYKHWVHEGGISTPFVAHWPLGITSSATIFHQPAQLTDIMATCLDIAGVKYPQSHNGRDLPPAEGVSLAPAFRGERVHRGALYWEHEGNCAVRRAMWKLVRRYPNDWELYDMDSDRSELTNLSAAHPNITDELSTLWDSWAYRVGVKPWDTIRELRKQLKAGRELPRRD